MKLIIALMATYRSARGLPFAKQILHTMAELEGGRSTWDIARHIIRQSNVSSEEPKSNEIKRLHSTVFRRIIGRKTTHSLLDEGFVREEGERITKKRSIKLYALDFRGSLLVLLEFGPNVLDEKILRNLGSSNAFCGAAWALLHLHHLPKLILLQKIIQPLTRDLSIENVWKRWDEDLMIAKLSIIMDRSLAKLATGENEPEKKGVVLRLRRAIQGQLVQMKRFRVEQIKEMTQHLKVVEDSERQAIIDK